MDIDKFHQQQMSDEIKRINAALDTIAPSDISKLEEYIFSNIFIPLFAGDDHLLYNVTFQTWINYAGGPYKEVHIVDNEGTFLFTVPPLLDRTVVNSVSNFRTSIASVIMTAQQYSRIHPNQGRTYLSNELNKRASVIKVPANMLNNLETWNTIFKRYGRPEIMPVGEKADMVLVSKTNAADFEAF